MRLVVVVAIAVAGCEPSPCAIVVHPRCDECGPGEVRSAFTIETGIALAKVSPAFARVGGELVCVTCEERLAFDDDLLIAGAASIAADSGDRERTPGADGLVFARNVATAANGMSPTFLIARDEDGERWRVRVSEGMEPGVFEIVAGPHGPFMLGALSTGIVAFGNDGAMRYTVEAVDGVLPDATGGAFVTRGGILMHVDATGATTWARTLSAVIDVLGQTGDGVVIAGRFSKSIDLGERQLTAAGNAIFVAHVDAANVLRAAAVVPEQHDAPVGVTTIEGDFVVAENVFGRGSRIRRITADGALVRRVDIDGAGRHETLVLLPGRSSIYVELRTEKDAFAEGEDIVTMIGGRRFGGDGGGDGRTHHVAQIVL